MINQRKQGRKPIPASSRRLPVVFQPHPKEIIEVKRGRGLQESGTHLSGKAADACKRLCLIARHANHFYQSTETWSGTLGMEIAYLFAAIAQNQQVQLNRRSSLLKLLRRIQVSPEDLIWKFIRIES